MKHYLCIILLSLARAFPFARRSSLRIIDGPNRGKKWFIASKDNSYMLGCYEQATLQALAPHIKPGNVVYDIGANEGYFSLAFSGMTGNKGKVFAFEPFPSSFAFLQQHIHINHIQNITAYSFCISDKNGRQDFSASLNPAANTYIQQSPVFRSSAKINVETASLDSLLEKGAVDPPGVIKIDVEGAEYDVLRGAEKLIAAYRPVLFVATHNNHCPGVKENCCTFLREKNYSLITVNRNASGAMEDFLALPL